MTDPVLTLLRRAKARIQNQDRWCTNKLTLDAHGHGIAPTHPRAVKWCARGALYAEYKSTDWSAIEAADKLLNRVAVMVGIPERRWKDEIVILNNKHGHAKVMGAFDWAIRMRELVLEKGME